MLAAALYFLFFYMLLLPALWRLGRKLNTARLQSGGGSILWNAFLLVVLLLLPLTPYLQVACLTREHRAALEAALPPARGFWAEVQQPLQRFWVLRVTASEAEVYLLEPCRNRAPDDAGDRCAALVRFDRVGSGWRFRNWTTVWSDNGLARGNVFPPDPAAFESLFKENNR